MATNDFWSGIGAGLLDTGVGMYTSAQERKAREDALRRAQSPLYDQATQLAGTQLSLAGSFDPAKAAADQYGAYRTMTEAGKEQDQNKLMRSLHKRGLLGVASFDPVAGTKATPGVAVNPHVAALLAAQAGADEKAAFDAMQAGDQRLNNIVSRAASTAGIGRADREATLKAMKETHTGVKPSLGAQLGGALLKDPKLMSGAAGLLGKGLDWLKGLGGSGPQLGFESMYDDGGYAADWPMPDFSDWYGGMSSTDWGWGW